MITQEQLNELYYHAKMLVILLKELNHSVDDYTGERNGDIQAGDKDTDQ